MDGVRARGVAMAAGGYGALMFTLLCGLPQAAGQNAVPCTRGYIQNCAEAMVNAAGECVCKTCHDRYVLSTDGRMCNQLNIVQCGEVAVSQFDECVLNAAPDGETRVCTCGADFACVATGVCKDLRCAHRIHGCAAYVRRLEDSEGDCACLTCDPGYVLHNGRCYAELTCGQVAQVDVQCPEEAPAVDGVCTCGPRHRCSPVGICVKRRTHTCDTPVTNDGVCVAGTVPVEGVCRCTEGLTCMDNICTIEYLMCGQSASEAHQSCQPPLLKDPETHTCVCADTEFYKCGDDGLQCVPKRCGADIIADCETYVREEPVDGKCFCRKCAQGMQNNYENCAPYTETPSPNEQNSVRVVGVYAHQTGANAPYEIGMKAAAQLAMRDENAVPGRDFLMSVEVVDAAKVSPQAALDYFREKKIHDFVACAEPSCPAKFSTLDLSGLRFWNPSPYAGQLCAENVYSTGLVPNQGLKNAVKWSFENFNQGYIIVEDDSFYSEELAKIAISIIEAIGSQVEAQVVYSGALATQLLAMETMDRIQKEVVVLNLLYRDRGQQFLRDMASLERSSRFTVLSAFFYEEDVFQVGVQYVAGHYTFASYFSTLANGDPVFVDEYRAEVAPLMDQGSTVQPPSEISEGVYQAVRFIGQSMALGGVTRDMVIRSHNGDIVTFMQERRHVQKGLAIAQVSATGQLEIIEDETSDVYSVPEPSVRITPTGPRPVACNREKCKCDEGFECIDASIDCLPRLKRCGERLEHPAERCKFYGLKPNADRVCECGPGTECSGQGACIIADRALAESSFYAVMKVLLNHPYRDILTDGKPNELFYKTTYSIRLRIAQRLGVPVDNVHPRRVCSSDTIFSVSLYDAECVEYGLYDAYAAQYAGAVERHAAELQLLTNTEVTNENNRKSLHRSMLPAAEFALDIRVPPGTVNAMADRYEAVFKIGSALYDMEVVYRAVWLKTFPEQDYVR